MAAASRRVALRIMEVALEAANPTKAIGRLVSVSPERALVVRGQTVVQDLDRFDRAFVFGAGKASCEMASAFLKTKGVKVDGGLVITKTDHAREEDRKSCEKHSVQIVEASHPIPCEKGAAATSKIISMLKEVDSPNTLVIWLASGGGSALTGGVGVKDHLDLPALKEAMQWLLDSGAEITQVNAIRKHLCIAHGGRIGSFAGRSTVVTICISDIIGSPLHAIAGGPTTPDQSTLTDCQGILKMLSANRPLAKSLKKSFFSDRIDELVEESPKQLGPNILPGIVLVDLKSTLTDALQFCQNNLNNAETVLLSSKLSGEASSLGKFLAKVATDVKTDHPFILLAGGETTVTMDSTKSGLGGRNQELALAAAVEMSLDSDCSENVSFLAIGTDGTDGPTIAAGAIVNKHTITPSILKEAQQSLLTHDSFNFFRNYASDAHVITGPTGTNVMDIDIICNWPPHIPLPENF